MTFKYHAVVLEDGGVIYPGSVKHGFPIKPHLDVYADGETLDGFHQAIRQTMK